MPLLVGSIIALATFAFYILSYLQRRCYATPPARRADVGATNVPTRRAAPRLNVEQEHLEVEEEAEEEKQRAIADRDVAVARVMKRMDARRAAANASKAVASGLRNPSK